MLYIMLHSLHTRMLLCSKTFNDFRTWWWWWWWAATIRIKKRPLDDDHRFERDGETTVRPEWLPCNVGGTQVYFSGNCTGVHIYIQMIDTPFRTFCQIASTTIATSSFDATRLEGDKKKSQLGVRGDAWIIVGPCWLLLLFLELPRYSTGVWNEPYTEKRLQMIEPKDLIKIPSKMKRQWTPRFNYSSAPLIYQLHKHDAKGYFK